MTSLFILLVTETWVASAPRYPETNSKPENQDLGDLICIPLCGPVQEFLWDVQMERVAEFEGGYIFNVTKC